MILIKNNKKANFEELKTEIYSKIININNSDELIKELKNIINFYEESEMTKKG